MTGMYKCRDIVFPGQSIQGNKGSQKIRTGTHRFGTSRNPTRTKCIQRGGEESQKPRSGQNSKVYYRLPSKNTQILFVRTQSTHILFARTQNSHILFVRTQNTHILFVRTQSTLILFVRTQSTHVLFVTTQNTHLLFRLSLEKIIPPTCSTSTKSTFSIKQQLGLLPLSCGT